MGLTPAVARGLDWCEVDFYQQGYEVRCQKELRGHRLTARLIYNALAEKQLTESEFLHLPALDKPIVAVVPTKSMEQWRAELAAQNAQLLAQQTTPNG